MPGKWGKTPINQGSFSRATKPAGMVPSKQSELKQRQKTKMPPSQSAEKGPSKLPTK